MQIKKYPHLALENYSKILVQLGFVLSLFIVYQFLQLKSYPKDIKEISVTLTKIDDTEQIVEFKPFEVEVPKTQTVQIPDKIVKVDDNVEVDEIIIESTETDESEAIVVDNTIKTIVEEEIEEEVVEDVPFMIIEEVPVFPGCTGNNTELRNCFSDKISNFVLKNFNSELSADLGLIPGSTQRIFVLFKIDKNGDITDIQARAPHIKLQQEAIRVIEMLPKMTPGKQRGRPVGVKYGLPITFKIQ
jgi:protein TonB